MNLPSRCSKMDFVFYRLWQCCQRSLSDLARGSSYDGALGRSRSGCGAWLGTRGWSAPTAKRLRSWREGISLFLLCRSQRSTPRAQERNRHIGRQWNPNVGSLRGGILGTGFVVAAVVGSGIMAKTAFLAAMWRSRFLPIPLRRGAALVALILAFGRSPERIQSRSFTGGRHRRRTFMGLKPSRTFCSISGGIAGAILGGTVCFGFPQFPLAITSERPGPALIEFVASFGLLSVIWGCSRSRPSAVRLPSGVTSPLHTGSLLPLICECGSDNRKIAQRHIRRNPDLRTLLPLFLLS